MALTVILVTGTGMLLLGLSFPLALLLGAILAPTDPVLASSVQVEDKDDRDRLRQALTGEAGINDSSAFPLIYLAMGLLVAREFGAFGEVWLVKDLLWGISGALGIGWFTGWIAAQGVVKARARGWENHVLDDFMAVGVMATSYGLAMWLHTYGFVAVFIAGLSFRWYFEHPKNQKLRTQKNSQKDSNLEEMIQFHDQLERFCEIFGVIALGALASLIDWQYQSVLFGLVLFFVLRPLATRLS